MIMLKTGDIKKQLVEKFQNGDFRVTKSGIKTVELQGVQFEADKDYIVREPNYEYAEREIKWYESQSRNVNDIPGKVPTIWQQVADVNGDINSNYGWMIFSKENGSQYKNALWNLKDDMATRQAVMIYNRPSMHQDWNKNHMHDFCCTFSTQLFLNEVGDHLELEYIVYQRSMDGVFGYDNDVLWHKYVQLKASKELEQFYGKPVICKNINYNAGSLHIYERHFKYLANNELQQ